MARKNVGLLQSYALDTTLWRRRPRTVLFRTRVRIVLITVVASDRSRGSLGKLFASLGNTKNGKTILLQTVAANNRRVGKNNNDNSYCTGRPEPNF